MRQKAVVRGNERARKVTLKDLMGSGDKIMLLAAPFLVIGLVLNILFPAWFEVGGPSQVVRIISAVVLAVGVVLWLWSVYLVLTKVPQRKLITEGPFALMKHPLYTSVGLLVLPWLGFLLNSWLGAVVGIAVYVGSRLFAGAEEAHLAKAFGANWKAYKERVLIKWL